MKRIKLLPVILALILAVSMIPAVAAAGDGAETPVQPSSDGVTNPAAEIELVNPDDATFYLYTYEGTDTLQWPQGDYPYHPKQYTVKVKLTGEDPSKPCDDNICFFSGNECDVYTVSQQKEGKYGNIREITIRQHGYGGPAPYSVWASSGVFVKQIFYPTSVFIPDQLTLNYTHLELTASHPVGRLVPSDSEVTWSSSDSRVAAVQNGVVTAGRDGTATVTATYTKYGLHLTASCKVTVGSGTTSGKTVVKNGKYTAGSGTARATYQVRSKSGHTVAYRTCRSKSRTAVIPTRVKLADGRYYRVTAAADSAFAAAKKVKTVQVKSGSLTKKSVRNCLRRSHVTTVKTVKYKQYKKYFTKKNCGRKVKVKKL
ncbi:MAG: Ig-like domain-containing protein [Anaerovoracaceae bacterium]|jgi:hypothetical protein